jgi:hypothetical protein
LILQGEGGGRDPGISGRRLDLDFGLVLDFERFCFFGSFPAEMVDPSSVVATFRFGFLFDLVEFFEEMEFFEEIEYES